MAEPLNQGVPQQPPAAANQHYEMRMVEGGQGKLYIGGQPCTVKVGGEIITDPVQLEKLAKTFRKTVAAVNIEKGEVWRLTPEGINVTGSKQPKSVSLISSDFKDMYARRMNKFLLANAKKTDEVAKKNLPKAQDAGAPPPPPPRPPRKAARRQDHGEEAELNAMQSQQEGPPVPLHRDRAAKHVAAHDNDEEIPPPPPPPDEEGAIESHAPRAEDLEPPPPPPPDDEESVVVEEFGTDEFVPVANENHLAEILNERAEKVADDIEVAVDESAPPPPPPPPQEQKVAAATTSKSTGDVSLQDQIKQAKLKPASEREQTPSPKSKNLIDDLSDALQNRRGKMEVEEEVEDSDDSEWKP